jgi:hypothetical protein
VIKAIIGVIILQIFIALLHIMFKLLPPINNHNIKRRSPEISSRSTKKGGGGGGIKENFLKLCFS